MAEGALRQRDDADRAAHPHAFFPSVNREQWTEIWLATNTDNQRLLNEYIGEEGAQYIYLRTSARIIALVHAPWTPADFIGSIHRIFSDATPVDGDLHDFGFSQLDYTDYVRQRIPADLLRAAAASPDWQGSAWNAPAIRRALRAGFADRIVVEQSNVTTRLAHSFGTPIATLVGMFLSARIDHTPEGRVPQRPMVQRYFPPAAVSSRRRGAGDDPAGHDVKRARGSK